MNIEVGGEQHVVGPGTSVVFPAGVPHRNWNSGRVPTLHLAIAAPPPPPDRPFATTVGG